MPPILRIIPAIKEVFEDMSSNSSSSSPVNETTRATTVSLDDETQTLKGTWKVPGLALYIGITAGVVLLIGVTFVVYLFLKSMFTRKQEQRIGLDDLRGCHRHSRSPSPGGHNCSPEYSPEVSTLNSAESMTHAPTLSPDWSTIPDIPPY